MTDSINTPQNNQSSERPGAVTPRADAHRTTSPASDMTEPVPAVPTAPPGLESVTGEPGYSARHASDSETPGTTDRSRSGQSGASHSGSDQSSSNQSSPGQNTSGSGKSDQAKGAAQDVAGDAKDAGRAVKDTAAQEAAGVKDDAVREAKRLGNEAGTMLESQASEQLDRAAGVVRTFSDDVARIARGEKPEPGVAKDLVDQLNSRAEATATWLEDHDPKEVLQEVQSFARRRPVAFLAIAASVGFAAGRVTRGLKQHHADDDRQGSSTSSHGASSSTPGTPPGKSAGTSAGTSAGAASGPARGTSGTATGPVPGTIPAGSTTGSTATGAPAYDSGPGTATPGYPDGSDPYAGGGSR